MFVAKCVMTDWANVRRVRRRDKVRHSVRMGSLLRHHAGKASWRSERISEMLLLLLLLLVMGLRRYCRECVKRRV